jgi:hypothetical protein
MIEAARTRKQQGHPCGPSPTHPDATATPYGPLPGRFVPPARCRVFSTTVTNLPQAIQLVLPVLAATERSHFDYNILLSCGIARKAYMDIDMGIGVFRKLIPHRLYLIRVSRRLIDVLACKRLIFNTDNNITAIAVIS